MTAGAFGTTPFSASIDMWLEVAGQQVPIAQMGPNFVVLRERSEFEPGEAVLVLVVDGQRKSWPVKMPRGGSASDRWVVTLPSDNVLF